MQRHYCLGHFLCEGNTSQEADSWSSETEVASSKVHTHIRNTHVRAHTHTLVRQCMKEQTHRLCVNATFTCTTPVWSACLPMYTHRSKVNLSPDVLSVAETPKRSRLFYTRKPIFVHTRQTDARTVEHHPHMGPCGALHHASHRPPAGPACCAVY